MDNRLVTLVSLEGKELECKRDVACMSNLVKEMIEEEEEEDEEKIKVPLPKVKFETLEKIIDFCNYHVDNPMNKIERPIRSTNLAEFVSELDAKIIDVEKAELFAILDAVNYMDIPSLLDLGCAKACSFIKGKSPVEIREFYDNP